MGGFPPISPCRAPRIQPSLTPERWQKIKELFSLALEREPSQRVTFLHDACGGDEALRAEVESLLASAESEEATTREVFKAVSSQPAASVGEAEDPMIGRRVGDYRIERRIGYGGMAAVYLASRDDEQFEMHVAIKLLRPDLDRAELLRRFLNERQTLAALDHPNIVKLLDGGSTEEGLPFLVMDYVDGLPIDEYCDAHTLSIQERLRLFCTVCEAVAYAHQHHVIHRDLKPSNALVTAKGTAKLLDFGIAKVLDPAESSQAAVTRTLNRRLTPAYASPEQVRGEPVTSATDVYSLGVVLYSLLTGHRPYKLKQNTPAAMERAICEQEPESPSTAVDRVETETLADGTTVTITAQTVSRTREGQPDKLRRSLRGDLDNIVLKALQKEPRRRYATVAELAEDIHRYLEHRPVNARPSTLAYRASKFMRRHKTEVIAAVMMATFLTAALGYTVWQQRRATERAREELASQRTRGRRTVAVLGFKNLSARADTVWLSTALSEMLTTELSAGGKVRMIPGESVAQVKINSSIPEVESLSASTLNSVYKNLGCDFVVLGSYLDISDAGRNIRFDLRVQDAALGETVAVLAESGSETALPDLIARAGNDLRQRLGFTGISASESASVQASLPSNPDAMRLYASGLERLRDFDALGARDFLQKAIEADPNYAMAYLALADAWETLGYSRKAVEAAKQAFDHSQGLAREDTLMIEGRYRQAVGDWVKAIGIYQTLFTFFPDNVDHGLRLASAQTSAGKVAESLGTIEALRKLPQPVAEDPRIDLAEADAARKGGDYRREAAVAAKAAEKSRIRHARLLLAQSLVRQARVFRSLGELKQSITAATEARHLFGEAGDRFGEAHVLNVIGTVLSDQGQYEDARKAFQEAMEIDHELGNKKAEAQALGNIAQALTWEREYARAEQAFDGSLAVLRELGDKFEIGLDLVDLGMLEEDTGHLRDAQSHLQEALAISRETGASEAIAGALLNLSIVLQDEGDTLSARQMATEAIEIMRRSGQKSGEGVALTNLAMARLSSGDLSAAQKLFSNSVNILKQSGFESGRADSLTGLAQISLIQGDLEGARQQYADALAIREKLADKGPITETHLSMADLSLEEGHTADAEVAARQAINDFHAQRDLVGEARSRLTLARCLLAQKKLPEAQEMLASALELLEGNEKREPQLLSVLVNGEVLTASGRATECTRMMEKALEAAPKNAFMETQFEGRLILGEAKIDLGNLAAGIAELNSLEHATRAKGFLLIARKAAAARKTQVRHHF